MFIPLTETYDMINESRVLSARDKVSTQNRFTARPQGILIQDTYNNPFFPIQPAPRIDTSKLNIDEVFQRYRELYTETKPTFLPWHYCLEIVGDKYYAFNTRPIDLKFPINTEEAKENKEENDWIKWDNVTEMFFDDKIYDIRNAVHICLIGSSDIDIYTMNMYSIIGQICITPLLRRYKLPGGLYQRVFPLNMGSKFKFMNISKFIRK